MLKEIQTSISANLYERMTSPLWGAIISGWLIVNWEVIYITFFEDEKYLGSGKLKYIIEYHKSLENFVFYPLLIAAVLLLIIPFISTGVYWTHLKFIKWKKDIRTKIENETVLTVQEAIKLRESLRNITDRYLELTKENGLKLKSLEDNLTLAQIEGTEAKDELQRIKIENDITIKRLQEELEELKIKESIKDAELKETGANNLSTDELIWSKELNIFKNNEGDVKNFIYLVDDLSEGANYETIKESSSTIFSKLKIFDLIEPNQGFYYLTSKGKFFAKYISV